MKVDLSPWEFSFLTGDHANIDPNRPETPIKQGALEAKSSVIDPLLFVSSQSPYMPVDQTSFDDTAVDLHRNDIDYIDYTQQRGANPVPKCLGDVATATRSVWGKKLLQDKNLIHLSFNQSSTSPPLFAQSTIKRVEYNPAQHNSAMGLKLSRSTFSVVRTDKMPSDDTHEHAKNVSRNHDNDELTSTPIKSAHPHSSKHQHFRPLRHKNHLKVMPCAPDPDTSEPIAISLTLHHSSSHVPKKSSQRLRHSHTRAHSHPQSVSSDSGDPAIPVSPAYQRSPPPPPSSFSPPKTRNSLPVRLGHPSRPYYTAIRKNISPPTPSRSRPQSVEAPMTSTATMTNASRHLSMSAMPPSAFSTLGVDDDNGDFEVHSGPTNSARLSLSSSLHRQSYDNRTQTHTHNAQSLSRAANGKISNRSNGFGFSMSGETELRMALAASSPPGVATTHGGRTTTEEGFRFRETMIPTQNMNNYNKKNIQNSSTNTGTDYTGHVGSRGSFMGRVKKLRKELKEMLMN